MRLATKTLARINQSLEQDGGAAFRRELAEAIKLCSDAFDPTISDGFRGHLGASLIGRECPREAWYTFRWATAPRFEARILRLFNRGHLEEARFIALLRQTGIKTWHTSESGKQFRITGANQHFGGSLDGVGYGIEELPGAFLLEFKTHGVKSFAKLVKEGVVKAKPEHNVQCCLYMRYYRLDAALYCAVCKDTDELHLEIIPANTGLATKMDERATAIIVAQEPPMKCSASPSWFACKFCSHSPVCHSGVAPARNCRTCANGDPSELKGPDGKPLWKCRVGGIGKYELTESDQRVGCPTYLRRF